MQCERAATSPSVTTVQNTLGGFWIISWRSLLSHCHSSRRSPGDKRRAAQQNNPICSQVSWECHPYKPHSAGDVSPSTAIPDGKDQLQLHETKPVFNQEASSPRWLLNVSSWSKNKSPCYYYFWAETVFPDPSGFQAGNPMGTLCLKQKQPPILKAQPSWLSTPSPLSHKRCCMHTLTHSQQGK